MKNQSTDQTRTYPKRLEQAGSIDHRIDNHAKASTTILNWLELAKTSMQHLNQRRTRKINSPVKPDLSTTFEIRSEASNTLQNHHDPYEFSNSHAKASTTILNRQKPSKTNHKNQAASRSSPNPHNNPNTNPNPNPNPNFNPNPNPKFIHNSNYNRNLYPNNNPYHNPNTYP